MQAGFRPRLKARPSLVDLLVHASRNSGPNSPTCSESGLGTGDYWDKRDSSPGKSSLRSWSERDHDDRGSARGHLQQSEFVGESTVGAPAASWHPQAVGSAGSWLESDGDPDDLLMDGEHGEQQQLPLSLPLRGRLRLRPGVPHLVTTIPNSAALLDQASNLPLPPSPTKPSSDPSTPTSQLDPPAPTSPERPAHKHIPTVIVTSDSPRPPLKPTSAPIALSPKMAPVSFAPSSFPSSRQRVASRRNHWHIITCLLPLPGFDVRPCLLTWLLNSTKTAPRRMASKPVSVQWATS